MRHFIDTSFLVGLTNIKDKYHEKANKKLEQLQKQDNSEIFISDYVIVEFLSILLKGSSIEEAIEWGKIIYSEELANIIYCSKEINMAAWKIFQEESGERKPLNLTDCIVYVKHVMLKCEQILTYDDRLKNFEKMI